MKTFCTTASFFGFLIGAATMLYFPVIGLIVATPNLLNLMDNSDLND